jgi:hypothetical protein
MGFGLTRGKDKLYKQWSEHSGLPVEAIPGRDEAKETPVKMGEGGQRPREGGKIPKEGGPILGGRKSLYILYILLGVAIVVLCVGVAILLMQAG